ncbi:MAG: hypothetical protein AAF449_03575, partial [Myxococcota bacterium]
MTSPPAEEVLRVWTERDLTEASRRGGLSRAHGIDDALRQIDELLRSRKHPVLAGPSGVGKTALVQELVARCVVGSSADGAHRQNSDALTGRRVLQFSFRRRVAALKKASDLGESFDELISALEAQPDVVPFFRDLHLAYAHDLEALIEAMCYRLDRPIMGEGRQQMLESMLEDTPELNEHFVIMRVDEPSLPAAHKILSAWAEDYQKEQGVALTPTAIEHGLQLAHRFLSRDRLPRSVLDLLRQTASLVPRGGTVEAGHVIARFSENQRVPRRLVDPEAQLDLA